MGVDGVGHVVEGQAGPRREHELVHQLGHVRTDETGPDDAPVVGAGDDANVAVALTLDHGLRVSVKTYLRDHNGQILGLRLVLGRAEARHLGMAEDAVGHEAPIDRAAAAEDRVLGRGRALPVGPVGQQRRPGDVAGREHVVERGALRGVGHDEAVLVDLDAGLLETQAPAHRRAPDAHQHESGGDRRAVGESEAHLVRQRHVDALDPGLQPALDAGLAERLGQRRRRPAVLAGHELVEHLDDRHPRAELREDRSELAADRPAADDRQTGRQMVELEQLVARHHALVVDVEHRQHVGREPVAR